MTAGRFAFVWISLMVVAIAANAEEVPALSKPPSHSKAQDEKKDDKAEKRREGETKKASPMDVCSAVRPDRDKSEGPRSRKRISESCSVIKSAPNCTGTLGGSGKSNGWYFDADSETCKDTQDLGSCSSSGPFKTKSECKKAVKAGDCDPFEREE